MLEILDESFKIIQTVPKVKSITWTSRFTESGSFRLQLPHDFQSSVDLMGKFIRHKGHYGIIQYISANEEQTEVRGYDLKAITIFRQVLPGTYTGAVETVIKQIVSDNTEGNRGFPRFSVATDQKRGETITYTVESPDTMENVLKKLCEDNGIGYTVTVQDKNMIFDVVIPNTVDHTYSERRQNITGWEYTHDQLTEKSLVINLGHADPVQMEAYYNSSKKVQWVKISGTICFPNGDSRHVNNVTANTVRYPTSYVWAFINTTNNQVYAVTTAATPSESSYAGYDNYAYLGVAEWSEYGDATCTTYPTENKYTIYLTEQEPAGFQRKETSSSVCDALDSVKSKATSKIQQTINAESITADVLSIADYKTVWNLGDYVKIKIYLFGQAMTVSRQITEIDEVYEPNNIKITPVFGKQKDNIIRKLQKGRM